MLPYFMMVGVPLYLSLFLYVYRHQLQNVSLLEDEYLQKRTYRRVIDAFFIIWIFLLVFRADTVGIDLQTYKLHFSVFSNLSWRETFRTIWSANLEPAYYFIIKIVSLFTDNFQWVIAISALISVVPIWRLYRKDGQNGLVVMLLFLTIAPFPMYFSGLRQAMAMAFVVPCYRYCKEKKLWKFLLTVFLAFFFHKSALIMVLIYPIYHLRLKKQIHILYLLPMMALIYIYNAPIFTFLSYIFYSGFMEGVVLKETGAYEILLLLGLLLIYCFLLVDQDKVDDEIIGLRNILVLCVFLQTFTGINSLVMRLNYYFLLFVPLLIDKIMRYSDEKYNVLIKVSKVLMIAFFAVYYFYHAYTGIDTLQVYPYASIF